MQFDDAAKVLDGVPYTSVQKGKWFYDLIIRNNVKDVLELGFAHGCSACYFGAAVQAANGHVDAVDREQSLNFEPSLETLSEKLGLTDVITPCREKSSYTWWLRNKIAQQSSDGVCEPCYDLIFIDGPKDWTNDGAAFFMADKLLRPGGIMLFDDMDWTYRKHEAIKGAAVEGYIFPVMSEQELATPQVADIFYLLVAQHPSYSSLENIDDEMGLARKVFSADQKISFVTKHSVAYSIKQGLKKALRGAPKANSKS